MWYNPHRNFPLTLPILGIQSMKQKLFCLCVVSLFAFAMANVTYAQTLAPAADAAGCPCVKMAACKCAAACNPCGYRCAPCGPYYTYPYYAYPYYPGYRVGLFGCVRPVAYSPYYYSYPCGYYPRYCW